MTRDLTAVSDYAAPLYVAWEITHRCNARCLHCYSNSGPDATCETDLSTDAALDLIHQLSTAGVIVLAFSGGEPLLRSDWRKLVSQAVSSGMSVNIGTNGSTITPRIAEELKRLGVKSVTVSLDSHNAETHDYFRQTKGLHSKAIEAVKALVNQDMRVVIGFTPTTINWQDGREVVELALSLGATAVNLSEFVPAGRGDCSLSLSQDDLHHLLTEWIALSEKLSDRIQIMWHDCRVAMLVPEAEKQLYFGCGAGRLVARICPDGAITPCVFLPTVVGTVREEPFAEIWKKSTLLQSFRLRRGYIGGNCGGCEYLETCGGCRAVAYAYTGDPLAGDEHCWVNRTNLDSTEGLIVREGFPR